MKNRTLKIMLGAGITCIIIVSAGGGPAIILLPLMIIGVILTVVSLWIILTGFPKIIFLVGAIIGVIGLILGFFWGNEYERTSIIIIGLGVLIGYIAILVGYSDIEYVNGWDRDL